MEEKQTDFCMMEIFKSITGTTYNTNNNKDIFGLLIHDGWFIIDDNTLLIIEDKRSYDLLQEAKNQMLRYAKIANNKYKQIYSFNNRINKDKILSTKINIPIYVGDDK